MARRETPLDEPVSFRKFWRDWDAPFVSGRTATRYERRERKEKEKKGKKGVIRTRSERRPIHTEQPRVTHWKT